MSEENNDEDVEEYEGYPIVDTAIIINKTGDGLSDAVHVEPITVEPNQDVHAVMRLRKTKDRYDFLRDKVTGKIIGVKWIQVFDCTGAAFSDNKMSAVAVQKMVDRVAEAKALAKGQLSMGIEVEDDDNVHDITKAPRRRKAT